MPQASQDAPPPELLLSNQTDCTARLCDSVQNPPGPLELLAWHFVHPTAQAPRMQHSVAVGDRTCERTKAFGLIHTVKFVTWGCVRSTATDLLRYLFPDLSGDATNKTGKVDKILLTKVN